MDSRELRQMFLDYFRREGHQVLPSSSLVPDDPTLLFTSAGMVQFKDIFWGRVAPAFPRVATCQKCFRTTDVERVGTSPYHHTFLEMLGNFSFGDYFKEGAITLAWAFLTRELSLPAERLWVSVYEDDEEAYAIWRDAIGIPQEKIVRLSKEHNWWGPVGGEGPCGPDTEIFWDWGEDKACGPHCRGPACDCPRFSEIWNLVFTEYDAQPDGTFQELSQKNIDTGMGLERMAAVLQGVHSNFDTDLFRPIVERIEALQPGGPEGDRWRNLVADHARALVFLIADGVMPGNEKQGYVLRRVLRRAVRAADRLGLRAGVLAELVDPVVQTLGRVYPEIVERRQLAEEVLRKEEAAFRRTLQAGEVRLRELLGGLSPGEALPGEAAFELYDTYGFPLELTREIAAEAGTAVDEAAFERAMEAQRARSRKVVAYDEGTGRKQAVVQRETRFVGYDRLEAEATVAIVLDEAGDEVKGAGPGRAALIFSDQTPFYAEAGGQVADSGVVENLTRRGKAEVVDVQRSPGGTVHEVQVTEGEFRPGDRCRLAVDPLRRVAVARAHTATHLLHAALRRTVGEHAIQAGSWVGPEELRFDFTHFAALTEEQLAEVEEEAFAPVIRDLPVRVRELPLEEAKARGALAHFEEEYRGKDRVRVVEVPGVSMELCGGTHVARTGEIGPLVIVAEEAVAAGTRRIRALVGEQARGYLVSLREERRAMAELFKVPEGELLQGAKRARQEMVDLGKRLASLEDELAAARARELADRGEEVAGVKLVGAVVDAGPEAAKRLADLLADRLGRCAVVLGTRTGDRGVVVVKVSGEPRLPAGELVKVAAAALGGRGGGRPTFAQGGGPAADALPQAVERALAEARRRLR
ncbi:MAG: alanine--tRNA ligase [Candidatus Bipolaricaulaceae bacterium]